MTAATTPVHKSDQGMFAITNVASYGATVPSTHLARRLRELRQAQGLSLSEVARRARISKAYLSQLERGESRTPSFEVLPRLATALGVPVSDITGQPSTWDPVAEEPIPSSLRAFADSARLPDADVDMLSKIHYRGKRPEHPDDWAHLYETIKRTIR